MPDVSEEQYLALRSLNQAFSQLLRRWREIVATREEGLQPLVAVEMTNDLVTAGIKIAELGVTLGLNESQDIADEMKGLYI